LPSQLKERTGIIELKAYKGFKLTVLLVLLAGGVAGLILTRGSRDTIVTRHDKGPLAQQPADQLINQKVFETARRLSSMATTPDEQQLAQQAFHLADRELDLEYASALQATSKGPGPETPEVAAIRRRIQRIEAGIQSQQQEVDQLTEAVKKAKGARRDELQPQLDVSQAELNLYKEALGDAKDDLIAAGGDPHSRIQQLVEEHQAASQAADTLKFPPVSAPAAGSPRGSLLTQWSNWRAIGRKEVEIHQAQQEAYQAAAEDAEAHDALARQVQTEQAEDKVLASRSSRAANQPTAGAGPGGPASASPDAVSRLQRISDDRKALRLLGMRTRQLNNIGSVYGQWAGLVGMDSRLALHGIIAAALWIVVMLFFVFIINRAAERFFAKLSLEAKQRATLQAVSRISVQVVAVLVILIVIFGPPSQLSTVLGLAGAGLTVVLKDFIVSFLGWFVLMGRQGIRVGDWVEINGVHGEVIEITLLRTVLLELGNWTEAGQPTGRQVSFLNQYAIDGYYFNFTTSGQWLWDSLQVLIPLGRDLQPQVENIRAIFTKETENNIHLAEQEWQRVSRRYGVRKFSGEPSVTVKPTDTGVIVSVRYITRAEERTQTRDRLNHALVQLLHQGGKIIPSPETVPAPAGS
jgi:small-conductance mechanosensitive channel